MLRKLRDHVQFSSHTRVYYSTLNTFCSLGHLDNAKELVLRFEYVTALNRVTHSIMISLT